ncbi:MAG: DNA mismatch repair protein MutS [Muribaculaceae bacterium]|nr:DNA mismatch repair protein MutS [Muribaculaceae bacterium]
MAKKYVETPLMKQYSEMKAKHPDAVLLFRVGDFYETFSDDAITASEILGITLTRRANGAAQSVELAGFPHHALDTYLPRLVRAGKRVAICEQLEDPKLTKKLVKRGITELVTPGVAMADTVLSNKENNFLAAVSFGRDATGVAFLDISTGEFLTAQGNTAYIDKILESMAPKELIVEHGRLDTARQAFSTHPASFELDDWMFTYENATERLLRQFGTASLKGFGIDGMTQAITAAGAILHYLDLTKHTHTGHITAISRIDQDHFVRLDRFTVRNLELLDSLERDGRSLLSVLDRTVSPGGARLLRRWLAFPLKDPNEINARLDVVEYFFRKPDDRDEASYALSGMGDLERLISKLATRRITPREILAIATALDAVEPVRRLCDKSDLQGLKSMAARLDPCEDIIDIIRRQVRNDAPNALGRGPVFKAGVDPELDNLHSLSTNGKEYLLQIQARESKATGIPSLKIGFNNVFGYYIEVTNTHKDKVPAEWIRKQTLVNAERYITEELKKYEEQITGAQERIDIIERRLYEALLHSLATAIPRLQANAAILATVDVLTAFTDVARTYRYNRPIVDDSLLLKLTEARHPVIERQLPPGEPYISNSVELHNDRTQIMMITGPNMSGKSALLRQTALNVIMAQIGCFVAAESAHIGVIDKIFTRVGASDNISLGESTFMVEMNEAAAILNNVSQRSLILFDELGRGTSTYDGISIAWSIVEYLHQHGDEHPKTLFATHYHELNDMEASFGRIANYNVAVKEIDGKVVFLRKLAPGGSQHSFGIHVARLAGMPQAIIDRAENVLRQLERNRDENGDRQIMEIADGMQLSFFQLDDPVLEQVRDALIGLDINRLTPIEALTKLNDLRGIITAK